MYDCAYVAASGNKSIGNGNTQSWTSSTAMYYYKRYTCKGQTGGVTVTYIYTSSAMSGAGSSISYTAFNGSSGDRHWNAAVLWNTSTVQNDQYVSNCSTDHSIAINDAHDSDLVLTGPASITPGTQASFAAKVTGPDGGGTPAGTVDLIEQLGETQDRPMKDCAGTATGTDTILASATLSNGAATLKTPASLAEGTYKIYAVYNGTPLTSTGLPPYCLAPPQSGFRHDTLNDSLTLKVAAVATTSLNVNRARDEDSGPGESDRGKDDMGPNPAISVVDVATVAPKLTSGRCPAGKVAVQASVGSPTHVITETSLRQSEDGKITLLQAGIPDGTAIDLQLLCRPRKAPAVVIGRAGYGSIRGDKMATTASKSALFGGFGDDKLSVHHGRTLATGGPNKDRISLFAANSAAAGGPGNDRLKAFTSGQAVLNGGLGKDVLIGGTGATLINALDGRGGDTVICRGAKNRVLADDGDRLRGPCKRITPQP